MSSNVGDPGMTTDELPLLVASDSEQVVGEAGAAITGRARPVVISDSERASRWERDDYDPTVIQDRFTQPCPEAVSDDETAPRSGLARIVCMVVPLVLAVPALLVVALMIALADR